MSLLTTLSVNHNQISDLSTLPMNAELTDLRDATEALLKQMDADFIKKNLSPGGTADLLAMTYFLYLIKEDAQ